MRVHYFDYKRNQVVSTKGGKPVAALIDMILFDRMIKHMQHAFQDIQEQEVNDLLDEAIKQARK